MAAADSGRRGRIGVSKGFLVSKQKVALEQVIIRFAGDSGDGMQLTGDQFTAETASYGNDISTMPDFPAEIRAPQGTLPGVSAFQLNFADHDVLTPGDAPNVLVAMNPAALKANIGLLPAHAILIVNSDEFTKRNLEKVGYDTNPLEDGSLSKYDVHAIALTSQTVEALKGFDISKKDAERCKNMYALGMLSWLYSRPTDSPRAFLQKKFAKKPEILAANLAALEAGWSFGETTEAFSVQYEVKPASPPPGTYRYITGNLATAYGLLAASVKSGLPLFLGSYPITPASDILHELSKHKSFGVRTFQAEDEIAGIGSALGASYAGMLGITTTSGPGIALKSETIGLAVSLELPLVIVDVQRGGPSTGDVIDADGWFHTGDVGHIDDDGFLFITGRKKELLVTAQGKNVAPAPLEDRIRAHALVSQCMVVGDNRPYVAALITLDPEALGPWARAHGLPENSTAVDLHDNPELIADIQQAVDGANRMVSTAESIRKFKILTTDWTEAGGQLTPSLKLRRNVVMKEAAEAVESLYRD